MIEDYQFLRIQKKDEPFRHGIYFELIQDPKIVNGKCCYGEKSKWAYVSFSMDKIQTIIEEGLFFDFAKDTIERLEYAMGNFILDDDFLIEK